jgi:hypothetical protein
MGRDLVERPDLRPCGRSVLVPGERTTKTCAAEFFPLISGVDVYTNCGGQSSVAKGRPKDVEMLQAVCNLSHGQRMSQGNIDFSLF